MSILIEAIGWGGAATILAAYVANSNGWLDREHRLYQLMNLGGASAFVLYTGVHQTWATMTLNIIWAGVAASALIRILRRKKVG
mgnify:CR=1 FL=1